MSTTPAPLQPIEIQSDQMTRTGSMVYFSHAGEKYSLSTLLCSCPDVAITLLTDSMISGTDHAPLETIDAIYTCTQHGGPHATVALHLTEFVRHTSQAFAWVEQKHARDRRVAWGMSRRTV